MLYLLYETGRPEDVYTLPVMKLLESGLLRGEEGSLVRRKVDDEGFGYWSFLSRDERKAREFGRHRGNMLWRQGCDELSESDDGTFAFVYFGRNNMKHDYSGLPGTAPWLTFQHLIQRGEGKNDKVPV